MAVNHLTFPSHRPVSLTEMEAEREVFAKEEHRTGKSIKMGSRLVFAKGWGGRWEGMLLDMVCSLERWNVLELDRDDGYTHL